MTFNDIETLLIATFALILGHFIHKFVPWTARYNLPSSVLGGFVFALALMVMRSQGAVVDFTMNLQSPLMILFFASLGFSASLARLVAGGRPLILFFLITCGILVLQDVVGIGVALALGQNPLFGMMTSSVSLVGGPGTALAFAPLFEKAGMTDAAAIGLTAAVGGIVCAGLFGGPLSTILIKKYGLSSPHKGAKLSTRGEEVESFSSENLTDLILVHMGALVAAMCLGAYVSHLFESAGVTLPPYIGAMIVAAILRNLDDKFKWFELKESWLDSLGSVALAFFIAMTMTNLDFLKLKDLGLPIAIALGVQVVLVLLAARYIVFPLMGRNYEAAVLSGGLFGFMMGTVANAMANIEVIQRSKGPAPHAGLFISLVGACFIDFVNAGIITIFLNFF